MSDNKKINTKKLKKILIPIGIILVVFLSMFLIIRANSNAILTRLVYSAMPESHVVETQDGTFEYFVEYNEDFDPKEDSENPLQAYTYYYYDDNGQKVDMGPDAVYYDADGNENSLDMVFVLRIMEKLEKIEKVLPKVMWTLIVVAIVGLLVLWFFRWSKKQDLEKEMKYGNKKHDNKKNRKKK